MRHFGHEGERAHRCLTRLDTGLLVPIISPHEFGDISADGGPDDHPEAVGEAEAGQRRGAVRLGREVRDDHLAP